MLENPIEALKVERAGQIPPERDMEAKAYPSKGIRSYLRTYGIEWVISETDD